MSILPDYAPISSTPTTLWIERSNYAGIVLEGWAYGIHTCVFFGCLYAFRTRVRRRRVPWSQIMYLVLLFAMGTVNFAANTIFGQRMWIDNRNYPGGPPKFIEEKYGIPVNITGNSAYLVANVLAEALLLYRLYIIWTPYHSAVLFPGLIFLGSTAMGMVSVYQVARPGASFWTSTNVQFLVPYFTLSLSLNVIITAMIVARLYALKTRVERTMGHDHARPYTSMAAMFIESAGLYAVVGLIFLISFAVKSHVQNLVLPVLSQVICISPELIILRLALGRAWTRQTVLSSLGAQFSTGVPRFQVKEGEGEGGLEEVKSDTTTRV